MSISQVLTLARDVKPDDQIIRFEAHAHGRTTRKAATMPAPLKVKSVESDSRTTVLITVKPPGAPEAIVRIEGKARVVVIRVLDTEPAPA